MTRPLGRNPTFTVNGVRIATMGDPHLGRRFVNGVPLHRRGERETLIWSDFTRSLTQVADVHVCMGDLFDRAVVPLDVIMRAAQFYRRAARTYPERTYVVLKGNHDAGGDDEATTSFDIFTGLVADVPNIKVVSLGVFRTGTDATLAFVPWSRHLTAAEAVEIVGRADVVFGHWDIHSFGDDRNLVPTKALTGITPMIVTGHDHTPTQITRDGVQVVGTGSLQPFTHGEDPLGAMYRTLPLSEALALPADIRRDLCLRVILDDGDVLPPPEELDCRQLDVVRREVIGEDLGRPIDLGALDISAIWRDAMAEHGVDSALSARLFEMYQNREIPK